ncbi:Mono [ADP-ribose] polymerase PARP16 [Cryptotermes secundus]|uniref:Poly [ADP-ribose] polymerase n=3 Tax=Cryptotermes secundus TaxID=105785 RepID=A0A2J7R3U4_9NEOP|nr:protein mono-ADP-ribosyltransferase PARP16 isoform X3 [Cryptotermes secundus]XP_023705782.1 protein mono-ADP-ribosyltransferase PARP16 isoform X3 [Cryptotermes secundus]XP_023705783.1 protein mono-ADP-ribosyltransferase PARP16 isoform X3 [Cryptotermes secundus]PNF35496.1 Mono [ADP-ribose] polymerase PARP16 [Cryptotermes secundus]PNF35500.1 Mono [ADP-ribose] polymerase PARP16 [Cryptotermes secundus]PNF35502.1 Mono [ADP-ribose] polymerase PARP16 [Cryptotermes secundus]
MQGERSETTFDGSSQAVDDFNVTAKEDKKIVTLRNILDKDRKGADLKLSLFVAACRSYRYDSCLKPFPPEFINNGLKDIEYLLEVIDKMPTLTQLVQELYDPDVYQKIGLVIDLLHWLLVELKDIQIKSVPKSEFGAIMGCVHCETAAPAPNLIFQLVGNPCGTNEMRWKEVSRGHKTLYAFHGSRLDNFHSILHYGLQKHFSKNSLFGHGIYLSSELSVSLPYSPMGYGWRWSTVGREMSCVALCEVVDHPDVKYQDKESARSRSMAMDSMGGEVPDKYYVVLNSDLVKVRYLLVYNRNLPQARSEGSGSWLRWMGRHKLLTFMLCYVVLLVSVGLSSSQLAQQFYHLVLKRTGL